MTIHQNYFMYRRRNKVFISYSHRDRKWLTELLTMLKPLTRTGAVIVWTDRDIPSGANWNDEIALSLASTNIAVLLVSADFLASDFIVNNELPSLLSAAQKEGLIVIWIPISHCLYKESELSKYQAAHDPVRPLDSLSPSDKKKAFARIGEIIKIAATATASNPAGGLITNVAPAFGILSGASTIQVSISQSFRLIDLLTAPESIKARDLHAVITHSTKMRRAMNARRKFVIPGLGSLKSIATIGEHNDDFWRVAVPDLRLARDRDLWFIPFELNLTERLCELQALPGFQLHDVMFQCGPQMKSTQMAGRLRIYPPGSEYSALR